MATTKASAEPKPTTESLADALAQFQAFLPRVEKDNVGVIPGKDGKQGYKYEYADLADISTTALPLLGRFGLSWSTKPTVNEQGAFVLEYRLRHAAGEEDIGQYPLPDPVRTPAQQVGSAITYARRYALCSVTGIAPGGDDDDGAAAQRGHVGPTGEANPFHSDPPASSSRPRNGNGNGSANGNGGGNGSALAKPVGDDTAPAAGDVSKPVAGVLSAKNADALTWWKRQVEKVGDGDTDATPHITQDDREALGLEEGVTLTVAQLVNRVGGYVEKYGSGPRVAAGAGAAS